MKTMSIGQLMAVAENPNTPAETLTKLAKDEDTYIRREVARNPNTDIETLAKLVQDEVSSVSFPAKRRIN